MTQPPDKATTTAATAQPAISARYRDLAAELTRRVEAVPADRWESQSPCSGWNTRDVLRHVISVHGDMPGYVGLSLNLTESVDDDPRAAWAEARDQMQALLDDPERAGLEFDGYFGRTSLEKTVDNFLCFDLLVHGWDLARASGQDEALPADEVHRVYAMAVGLGDNLRSNGVCGPEVSVPDDASEQARLLGLLGRTP
jgi:uncharacterized protein (TIGR03086 family)